MAKTDLLRKHTDEKFLQMISFPVNMDNAIFMVNYVAWFIEVQRNKEFPSVIALGVRCNEFFDSFQILWYFDTSWCFFLQADRLLEDFEQHRDLSRTVVHIDMDAFYAAVEMRDNPSLKTKPMAVGGNSMLVILALMYWWNIFIITNEKVELPIPICNFYNYFSSLELLLHQRWRNILSKKYFLN